MMSKKAHVILAELLAHTTGRDKMWLGLFLISLFLGVLTFGLSGATGTMELVVIAFALLLLPTIGWVASFYQRRFCGYRHSEIL